MMDLLAPYVSLFGFGSFALVSAALAIAWYFPPLRVHALIVACAVLVVFGAYKKGVRDTQERWEAAAEAERERMERVQAPVVDQANEYVVEMEAERDRAERQEVMLKGLADADEDAQRIALPKRSVERMNEFRQ